MAKKKLTNREHAVDMAKTIGSELLSIGAMACKEVVKSAGIECKKRGGCKCNICRAHYHNPRSH